VSPDDAIFTYDAETFDPDALENAFTPADGCGVITTRAQELNGPNPAAGGYTPCTLEVDTAGIWEVHFVSPDPTDDGDPAVRDIVAAGNLPQPDDASYVTAWDVTVTDAADNEIPGRVYANYLALNMGSNSTEDQPVALNSEVFVQTKDGADYRLNLNGIDPYGFIFFANNKGFKDTDGNPIYRSLQFVGETTSGSVPGPAQLGDDGYTIHNPGDRDTNGEDINITHKLFFQPPDPTMPATAGLPGDQQDWLFVEYEEPLQIEDFTFTGREGTGGQAGTGLGGNFSFTNPNDIERYASYTIIIDVNRNGELGDANDRILNGQAFPGENIVEWDGLDGNGDPVPTNALSYNVTVQVNAGEVHFPVFDSENHPNGLIIERRVPTLRTVGGEQIEIPEDLFTIYYDDRYFGPDPYNFGLCAEGEPEPTLPPGVIIDDPEPEPDVCYGTPPDPRSGLNGVNSELGARGWDDDFGDRRGLNTWVLIPSAALSLEGGILIKQADLEIEKEHLEQAPRVGEPITYRIVVTNNGPSDVTDARVQDTVPNTIGDVTWTCEVDPVAAGNVCGAASGSGNVIDTTVDLENGATAIFIVSGIIESGPGTINTATVTRPPDVTDENPDNNEDSDSVTTPQKSIVSTTAPHTPDNTADTSDDPRPVVIGEELRYRLQILLPEGDSEELTIIDTLPTGLSFIEPEEVRVSFTADNDLGEDSDMGGADNDAVPPTFVLPQSRIDVNGQTLTFAIGSLNNNDSDPNNELVTLEFNALVEDIPSNVDGTQLDNDFSYTINNQDQGRSNVVTAEVLEPELEIQKAFNTDRAAAGDTVQITLVVENVGRTTAFDVVVEDPLLDLEFSAARERTTPGGFTFSTRDTPEGVTVVYTGGDMPAGAIRTFVFAATLAPGVQAGDTVDNVATITDASSLPDDNPNARDEPPKNAEDDLTVVEARVEAFKTDTLFEDANNNNQADPGDILEYEITIVNNSGTNAENVSFSDTPDPNTTLIVGSVTTNQGTVTTGNSPGDTSVAVEIGTLATGNSVEVRFQVEINDPLPAGVTRVRNQGLATGDDIPPTPTDDPDTPPEDDPTDTPVSTVPAIDSFKRDVLLRDNDDDGVPSPGDALLYEIEVENTGNAAAENVVFTDTPDPNTTLVVGTVQTSQGTVTTGNTAGDTSIEIEIGTLGAGVRVDISFEATINDPLPAGVTEVANQGLFTGDNVPDTPTDDPDTPPEDDPTRTPVTPDPKLDAFKRDTLLEDTNDDGQASPGETLVYDIRIINTGNITVTGLIFTDTPDPNTTLVAGTVQTSQGTVTTGNTAGDTSIEIDLGTIGIGAEITISFEVTVNDPLPDGVDEVANQGFINGDGVLPVPTDDPDTTPEDDPTRTPVGEEDPRAITLLSFIAQPDADGITVRWVTGSEIDTWGFYLLRSSDGTRASAERVTPDLILAEGDTNLGASYEWFDGSVAAGNTYTYWLQEIELDGTINEYGTATARFSGVANDDRSTLFLPLVQR
jgi:uncharacterized repeat protein (TIGR01451 family)